MKRICLALPTNRPCAATIAAVHGEAVWAAARFAVEVHVVVLDSCSTADFSEHAAAVKLLRVSPGVVVHHIDEGRQGEFLRTVIERSAAPDPERLFDLMLPEGVSYGACTNRVFLVASALGCSSVHRRDSDSHYQSVGGETIYPIGQELASLGLRAADAVSGVTVSTLDPVQADQPVSLVAGSFIGELSVDVSEIRRLDPEVYQDLIGLLANSVDTGERPGWGRIVNRWLADKCFVGGGSAPFTSDRSTLGTVDIYSAEMCNVALSRELYERVPLPPAEETIGSDYFLIHLAHDTRLPGVVHNRHIVNYYTPERRTRKGFLAYQTRFVKLLLSTPYLSHAHARFAQSRSTVLDERSRIRADAVAAIVRESLRLSPRTDEKRLAQIIGSYRRLGGQYADLAGHITALAPQLIDEVRTDIVNFALLVEAWSELVEAATGVDP
ncbi:DUF6271 family protein [Kitasatospora terrestris]|uniref:DUF6271 family protein n=1 Tax=Kitasatospora terrestris TaxID=258051 RepID=A0ABP9DFK1_9ACTN